MVTFTEEILNGKLYFLCSASDNYLRDTTVTCHQSKNVKSLLEASWAPKTQQNYKTHISNLIQYCGKTNEKEHSKRHLEMVWSFYQNCSKMTKKITKL